MTHAHPLAGRVCLITGASSGIGAHLARRMAQAGAQVVLGARRTELTGAIAEDIDSAGGKALAVPLDVTSESSIAEAFASAESRFGPVDTVVANAGVVRNGRSTDVPEADLRRAAGKARRGGSSSSVRSPRR